jgi:hypothetical protein
MPTLHLKIREGCEEPYIEFHVDGEDLGRRVSQSFGEASSDDVLPWFGGDYILEETVLGDAVRARGSDQALFLACGCGHSACSGVWARVTVAGETITLSHFSTWCRRGRVEAALEPVVFDRRQLEDAVAQLRRDIESWRPPTRRGT